MSEKIEVGTVFCATNSENVRIDKYILLEQEEQSDGFEILVTPKSPMGKSVLGLEAGEHFSYDVFELGLDSKKEGTIVDVVGKKLVKTKAQGK